MRRITGAELQGILPYFEAAGKVAQAATCTNGLCGTVIVKDGEIIGRGFNGPALGDENNRLCDATWNLSIKPKFDKTCCPHAEWRAILDACKHSPDKIDGSVLYLCE